MQILVVYIDLFLNFVGIHQAKCKRSGVFAWRLLVWVYYFVRAELLSKLEARVVYCFAAQVLISSIKSGVLNPNVIYC